LAVSRLLKVFALQGKPT